MKSIKNHLRSILQRETFNPSILGIFINPYYIIRRGLYKNIERHAANLKGKLLDFGCGNKPYRELFEVDQYIGLDIEESGNHKSKDLIDVFYDGNIIPFEDESFDSVFSSEVFEHVFNLGAVLSEINRVCKLNGQLLITVPFVWDEHEVPYDYGRYTSYGLKHVLEIHGFEVIHLDKSTSYVETVFQMWNTYVFKSILPNKILKIALTPIIISPITIIGKLAGMILPSNYDFYHNNIVLAKKVNHLSPSVQS